MDKGINITAPVETREAIDRSLSNPDEFKKNRISHLKEINPYLDGKISERVYNTLEDIKVHNKLPVKKKPLNLIRKWKILFHEKRGKGYLR